MIVGLLGAAVGSWLGLLSLQRTADSDGSLQLVLATACWGFFVLANVVLLVGAFRRYRAVLRSSRSR